MRKQMFANISAIKRYRKAYKNWISVLIKKKLGKERIGVVLKDGRKLTLSNVSQGVRFILMSRGFNGNIINEDAISFVYEGHEVKLHGWQYGHITSAFLNLERLDVKNKRVLDVGASIGDTAVNFVLRGAKEVVAFEPYPFPYRYAEKNVEENGFRNLYVINAGVGEENTSVQLSERETTVCHSLKAQSEGPHVPVYSLDYVIEKYGPFDVMKMNCEGCEYGAVLNSLRIAEIKQIEIEYHYGFEKLKERLEAYGFIVEVTKPNKFYSPYAQKPNMIQEGHIYAYKA